MRESGNSESDASSSGEDCFEDVGFMFDNALPKTRRTFRFGRVSVAVQLVDDDPGAVQSGHYVWPAAPALSAYLVDIDRRLALPRGGRCLELGAGCGLAGLVAARLEGTSVVVFTDHDPGVLDVIRESIAEQGRDPEAGAYKAAAKCRCVPLSWGPVGTPDRALLAEALSSASASCSPTSWPRPSQNLADDERHRAATRSGVGGKREGGTAVSAAAGARAGAGIPEAAAPKHPRQSTTEEEEEEEEEEEAGLRQDNGDAGDGGGGGGSSSEYGGGDEAVWFDLVIASDVIYSVSVVRPLFRTVDDLLPRCDGDNPRADAITSTPHPAAAAASAAARREPSSAGEEEAGEPGAVAAAAAAGEGHQQNGTVSGEEQPAVMPAPPRQSPPPLPPPPSLQGRGGSGEGAMGGADPSPVFLMSQSFGYDAETEREIDQACRELGLLREVVWDELPAAAPPAPEDQGQPQAATLQEPLPPPQGDGGVGPAERRHDGAVLDSGSGSGGGGGGSDSGSCCGGGGEGAPQLLLSRQVRAGTKLQRFWRL
eukprot:g6790.t1